MINLTLSTNSGFSFTIWATRRPSYRSLGLAGEIASAPFGGLFARVVEMDGWFQS